MNDLERDIQYLKGVGERRAGLFKKLGVTTVGTLLRYYPRSYINMLEMQSIASTPIGTTAAVRATVCSKTPAVRLRGGKTLARVLASDGESDLVLSYFNNKYAPAALNVGEEYVFYGKLTGTLITREMTNPTTVRPEELCGLTPQYSCTEGLSSRMIAQNVRAALSLAGDEIAETLSAELMTRCSLMPLRDAVRAVHFPKDEEQSQSARRRLIFEELLTLSLGMGLMKRRSRATTGVRIAPCDMTQFISSLPYELTGAQKRCINEIFTDFKKPFPMNRLLQGDVGSGKTVCAAAAVYAAFRSGYQSAVMAPTELLAAQHAETFRKLLEPFGVSVGLLCSSVKGKARAQLLAQIKSGGANLVVGTHALISEDVQYASLGLVVADEQHRFGVEQRSRLSSKGIRPHMLVMSATPIPRTLALIIYGDLDVSILDELPPGRKPVKTYLVSDELRPRYLGFVKKNVVEGRQAYIVCPLVEESETLEDTLSANEYKEKLEKEYLRGLRIGLVHGRMKPKEKDAVMASFRAGETDVLVSTTVIEVGVDVPNATLMIIENAERFGLSALHQLRGRVGRGAEESCCVLVSSSSSQSAKERLRVMTKTNDGFEIARADLKTRGPGDFFGSRQHGLPVLGIADLASDETVLRDASSEAAAILESDPQLRAQKHAALRDEVTRMFEQRSGTLN